MRQHRNGIGNPWREARISVVINTVAHKKGEATDD